MKIPVNIESYNWKLVRESDGLTNQSKDVLWLEFNDDGTFKSKHSKSVLYLANNYSYRNFGGARGLY